MHKGEASVQNLKPCGLEILTLDARQKDKAEQRLELKKITFLDIVSIVFILLLAVGIILKTKLGDHLHSSAVIEASIFHDGKMDRHVALDKNQEIDLLGGKMVVEVKDKKLRVKKSACPRQLCVNMGWIKHSGEIIVCIPFKTLIEVKSSSRPVVDAVVF